MDATSSFGGRLIVNTNQHYISQCLIRRFTRPDRKIERYSIKYGKWKTTGPNGIFSELGYNQLLAFGDFNNDLDDRLKALEDTLPETLKALDNAATGQETKFDAKLYEHFCWYCAFLWEMSPAQKAVAPINFIIQVFLECQKGKTNLLKAIGVTDTNITILQKHVANGHKLIITGKNYQQLVYRILFAQNIRYTYSQFKQHTKWTVYRSPLEVPIGDMALIKYYQPKQNVMKTILPLSSDSVLIGICPMTEVKHFKESIVYGQTLTDTEAEYVRGVICLSGLFTVAARSRIGDIQTIKNEASKTTLFAKIVDLDTALKAGLTPIMSEIDFLISPASTAEYVRYVHSIVQPPSLNPSPTA